MVVPERDRPGTVAMPCATPTSSASVTRAVRSVLRPFAIRSEKNSRKPVTMRAQAMNAGWALRASSLSLIGNTSTSGSVPRMTSITSRRAAGGSVSRPPRRVKSAARPRKNSTTIETISCQYTMHTAMRVAKWSSIV